MAGLLANWISKKILAEKIENKFGCEDPYFETVPATRLDGVPTGKVKKRRKALPPGISKKDGEVLTKVKRRAYRLDQSLFTCCGVKFGWGSVIGLVPAVGDALDAFMAMMVFRTCSQVEGGLPSSVKSKMMFNIILDFLIGLVRNNGTPIPAVDPSTAEEWDRLQGDRIPPEYVSREPSRNEHMSPGRRHSDGGRTPASPANAAVRNERKNGGGRGWFGFGRSKVADDIESVRDSCDRPDPRQSRR